MMHWVIVIILSGGHQEVVSLKDFPTKAACVEVMRGYESDPYLEGKTMRCVKRRPGMKDYKGYPDIPEGTIE